MISLIHFEYRIILPFSVKLARVYIKKPRANFAQGIHSPTHLNTSLPLPDILNNNLLDSRVGVSHSGSPPHNRAGRALKFISQFQGFILIVATGRIVIINILRNHLLKVFSIHNHSLQTCLYH